MDNKSGYPLLFLYEGLYDPADADSRMANCANMIDRCWAEDAGYSGTK